MLSAKTFANATTTIMVVFYIACWLISTLAPDLIFGIANAWMHSINIESLISFGTVLWGLISISLLTWITTYATIRLYNKWLGK
ncbi:MAG: hypothetical protein UV29_C0023G0003 [Candidatus Collierbacteria bacterium GW2011_GWD2_42_50]|nr:MAG: hypothetical protein UV29_C0023G0003 [Candidatus Collierbacteria bacterium GW2011_GWD2_42_50]